MLLCTLAVSLYQIDLESEVQNSLAIVSLPATLLHNLSEADVEIISRIHFMFFSKTGLFQVSVNPNPVFQSHTFGLYCN